MDYSYNYFMALSGVDEFVVFISGYQAMFSRFPFIINLIIIIIIISPSCYPFYVLHIFRTRIRFFFFETTIALRFRHFTLDST